MTAGKTDRMTINKTIGIMTISAIMATFERNNAIRHRIICPFLIFFIVFTLLLI